MWYYLCELFYARPSRKATGAENGVKQTVELVNYLYKQKKLPEHSSGSFNIVSVELNGSL